MSLKLKEFSLFTLDYILLGVFLILGVIGVLFIYSSGINAFGDQINNEYFRQVIWLIIGLFFFLLFSYIRFQWLIRRARLFYILGVAALLYVLFLGRVVNNAKSWIGIGQLGIQPSEFVKVATILMLGNILSQKEHSVNSSKKMLASSIFVTLLPVTLILFQPDMGTALVYFPILLVILFLAGIHLSYLFFIILTGLFFLLFMILPVWARYVVKIEYSVLMLFFNQQHFLFLILSSLLLILISFVGYRKTAAPFFLWFVYIISTLFLALVAAFIILFSLQEYQFQRIATFIDPQIDPLGAGWNVNQALNAVGSGGVYGKGWLSGTQSHFQFIPQQSKDFIFSIVSEEWGFVGGVFIFLLYAVLFIRIFSIMKGTLNRVGLYVCGGIVGMLFFHIVVSIGMTIGIIPVTGIPLPLLSYGGSSLLSISISLGIIVSIYREKRLSI